MQVFCVRASQIWIKFSLCLHKELNFYWSTTSASYLELKLSQYLFFLWSLNLLNHYFNFVVYVWLYYWSIYHFIKRFTGSMTLKLFLTRYTIIILFAYKILEWLYIYKSLFQVSGKWEFLVICHITNLYRYEKIPHLLVWLKINPFCHGGGGLNWPALFLCISHGQTARQKWLKFFDFCYLSLD